eukprot:gb/GFBE01020117.1/.p1 GENE.gb/GFBE01020117.1/~~gb/GFBE01020117.1/.p1  ORF type:complete len:141 (+),score=25.85 gb/GFBE01020117.1/:1-423(+)
MRLGGTERPGFSPLLGEKRKGVFKCRGCGNDLFSSAEKFESGTGWPSFAAALPGVEESPGFFSFLSGIELRCARCGSHLGHVFEDGKIFKSPRAQETGRRHCIDGSALAFYPEGGSAPVRGDGQASSIELDAAKAVFYNK